MSTKASNQMHKGTTSTDSTPTRAAFLAERKSGLGGSDAKDYLGIDPFGCPRRLWYEKTDVEPDYPVHDHEDLFERGHVLEPAIRNKFQGQTGLPVLEHRRVIRHKEHPELLVHVDGIITGLDGSKGVLECKSANRERFYQFKRTGIPDDYYAQLQHALMVTGLPWGMFAILWPDAWKQSDPLLVFRDEKLIGVMRSEALSFWKLVKNGTPPDALDPSSKQCHRCQWRTSCQGKLLLLASKEQDVELEYDPAISEITLEFLAYRDEVHKPVEAEFNRLGDALRQAMGDRSAVDTDGGRIYHRVVNTRRLDQKHIMRDMRRALGKVDYDGTFIPAPEYLVEAYRKDCPSRPLKVYAR